MDKHGKRIVILMADDDEDDRMMAKEALEETRLVNVIRFVEDGEALMDYLYRGGSYGDAKHSPRPGLILLDLNMPKRGRQIMRKMTSGVITSAISVFVLMSMAAFAWASGSEEARPPSGDLTELSLQDLMNVTVNSASKFDQKISEAPSSVTIITADEIRKYGVRNSLLLAPMPQRSSCSTWTLWTGSRSFAGRAHRCTGTTLFSR